MRIRPAVSALGRRYIYRPPSARHPLLLAHPVRLFGLPAPESLKPVDWREHFTPARDQGQEGSCSGFATAALREALASIYEETCPASYLSPQYLYARTRQAEGSFPQDSGCSLADEIETLVQRGVCPEEFAPYDADPKSDPSPACDVAARAHRIGEPVQTGTDALSLKAALQLGPVAIGAEIYESFESPEVARSGKVPIPVPSREGCLGGHAMVIGGFDSDGWFGRNSWGLDWGDRGWFHAPFGWERFVIEAWTAKPQ